MIPEMCPSGQLKCLRSHCPPFSCAQLSCVITSEESATDTAWRRPEMTTPNPQNLALEPAAQAFSEATAAHPFLYEHPPAEGRKAVDDVQDGPVEMPPADIEVVQVPGGPNGDVEVRIVKPQGVTGPLP